MFQRKRGSFSTSIQLLGLLAIALTMLNCGPQPRPRSANNPAQNTTSTTTKGIDPANTDPQQTTSTLTTSSFTTTTSISTTTLSTTTISTDSVTGSTETISVGVQEETTTLPTPRPSRPNSSSVLATTTTTVLATRIEQPPLRPEIQTTTLPISTTTTAIVSTTVVVSTADKDNGTKDVVPTTSTTIKKLERSEKLDSPPSTAGSTPSTAPQTPARGAIPDPHSAKSESFKVYNPGQIVIVGDSHTQGDFGQKLRSQLIANYKTPTALVAAVGASINSWLFGYVPRLGYLHLNNEGKSLPAPEKTCDPKDKKCVPQKRIPLLTEVLGMYKPQITILALGANNLPDHPRTIMLRNPKLRMTEKEYKARVAAYKENVAQLVTKMTKEIEASTGQCIWIAPPSAAEKNSYQLTKEALLDFYEALKLAIAQSNCAIYDKSINFAPVGGDGLHFATEASKPILEKWLESTTDFLFKTLPLPHP